MEWNIGRSGRAWSADEAMQRHDLAPGKVELIEGKLFCSEEDRINMLGLLLENVGVDKVIRLGEASVWREAVAHLRG
jgi:hypothetical protein